MFGYTIIKTSELEDLQAAKISLTTRCTNLSDEIKDLRGKLNRILAPLKAANEARRGKKRVEAEQPYT